MLIDTHCHLDFEQFDADRDKVIQRAREAGVTYIINIGTSVPASERSVALASDHECIFAAVGIHPHYVQRVNKDDIRRIENLSEDAGVVAIGEVGLDYYDRNNAQGTAAQTLRIRQRELLNRFIALAEKRKLPLIFHCREASDDLLAVIRTSLPRSICAVVHCFAGTREFLEGCLERGLYISFTANITFKKADALRDLVRHTPLQRILLETDAPFLAPQAVRGQRNEPAYVRFVAEAIAGIKQTSMEKVTDVTTQNAREFFGI